MLRNLLEGDLIDLDVFTTTFCLHELFVMAIRLIDILSAVRIENYCNDRDVYSSEIRKKTRINRYVRNSG